MLLIDQRKGYREKEIQRERGTGDEIDGATGGEGNTLKQRENTHSN
jgi:hypothetical protein